jgi:hypothetical protein
MRANARNGKNEKNERNGRNGRKEDLGCKWEAVSPETAYFR